MVSSVDEESLAVLLQRHAELESKHGDGDSGRFLSGWQCDNPQTDRISELVQQESSGINVSEYLYFDRDPLVMDRIGRFSPSARSTLSTKRALCRQHSAVGGIFPVD